MGDAIKIDGHEARVAFDPEIGMFRGEFLNLRGGADFYASTEDGLEQEGRISLQVYFDLCSEYGLDGMSGGRKA
ncbi:type II toxin-antitoxin system HicB family antitoxin [Jiella sonneratiae]|uniref:Type II toxin-antitoxin system HicB family antitoxin n=1 Tax=Jiella sonneratiae TaxID=2816856 RepID=A0ABS3J405_9HYPH|nr:type II toxin-antitoxin system HicB family antitoxin [Jiella sonneratiae]MBO0904410.1 type II toxin-antitoxin system HicB family antitoxin [Jiella sonneratiae]